MELALKAKELEKLVQQAREVASGFIGGLPPELLEPAGEVLITVEERPPRGDEDLLGVFEGPTREEMLQGQAELPPRIRLFVENIWFEAEMDLVRFREEIEVTLFHELGHYLGLEEDDLEARDLG